ncbi:hypothetical protein [Streptosporangium sp. NPDC051022]|uniref:hypothetical protein n=1 Tax=Streptosporangium sp. NPDC051022 TaxID=3155752 RepID=UPI003422C13E
MGWRDRLLAVRQRGRQVQDLVEAERRIAELAARLREDRARISELERQAERFRTETVVLENADLRQELAVLRTRLAFGDKTDLLRERETNRVLEARNAALEAQLEALRQGRVRA